MPITVKVEDFDSETVLSEHCEGSEQMDSLHVPKGQVSRDNLGLRRSVRASHVKTCRSRSPSPKVRRIAGAKCERALAEQTIVHSHIHGGYRRSLVYVKHPGHAHRNQEFGCYIVSRPSRRNDLSQKDAHFITDITAGGLAEQIGFRENDRLITVCDTCLICLTHDDVINKFLEINEQLFFTIVRGLNDDDHEDEGLYEYVEITARIEVEIENGIVKMKAVELRSDITRRWLNDRLNDVETKKLSMLLQPDMSPDFLRFKGVTLTVGPYKKHLEDNFRFNVNMFSGNLLRSLPGRRVGDTNFIWQILDAHNKYAISAGSKQEHIKDSNGGRVIIIPVEIQKTDFHTSNDHHIIIPDQQLFCTFSPPGDAGAICLESLSQPDFYLGHIGGKILLKKCVNKSQLHTDMQLRWVYRDHKKIENSRHSTTGRFRREVTVTHDKFGNGHLSNLSRRHNLVEFSQPGVRSHSTWTRHHNHVESESEDMVFSMRREHFAVNETVARHWNSTTHRHGEL